MSLEAMGWAWKQETGSSGQRLVLLALCDHMADHEDHDGLTAWPSGKRLADMCGLTKSTVYRHLDALVESGLVDKVERRNRKNGTLGTWRYRVDASTHPRVHESTDPCVVGQHAPTLTHEPLVPNRKSETSLKDSNAPATTAVVVVDPQSVEIYIPSDFDVFWRDYPRKVGKPPAKRAFKKAADAFLPGDILVGTLMWCEFWAEAGTEEQFIPHPSTFLNQHRFNDRPPAIAVKSDAMSVLNRMANRNQ